MFSSPKPTLLDLSPVHPAHATHLGKTVAIGNTASHVVLTIVFPQADAMMLAHVCRQIA